MTTPDGSTDRLYDYVAKGGPLDGQRIISRFPNGFLLVEKPTGLVWFYDSDHIVEPSPDSGTKQPGWTMRPGSPFTWDTVLSHQAAEGNRYDVIAHGAGEQTQ